MQGSVDMCMIPVGSHGFRFSPTSKCIDQMVYCTHPVLRSKMISIKPHFLEKLG